MRLLEMHYHITWLFIIGEVLFCESQYVPPQHLAEVLNISSSSDLPSNLSYSEEIINGHNSTIVLEELVQTTTKEELISSDEEITTTDPLDTSTLKSKIKDGSIVITTLSPNAEEINTTLTTIKSIVNITLGNGSNKSSDGLKSSNISIQVTTEAPIKEVTSVPKKEADPSLIRPSVVPKKGADPAILIPSVVGKKGADPTLLKPSATGRKGADPEALVPSVHPRKGVVYEDEDDKESLKNGTSSIDDLSKTSTNIKEGNQTDAVDIKSSLPVSNEDVKANSTKSSLAAASMGEHKYTPIIRPVPVLPDGSSIEEVEVPSTVEEIHMKPTAATDIFGKSLEIEMIVEEKSSNSGIIIGVILLLTLVTAVIFMGYRHFKEYWMKRHYSRMDFLVEGMYDM